MHKRILIVDDDRTLLFALEDYLGQRGYDVDCAEELEEACALLMNVRYDVVITDLRLCSAQGADGLRVIEMVRARSLPARVVVLTGFATGAVEAAAHHLQVARFFYKPVPLATVADAVSELLTEQVAAC